MEEYKQPYILLFRAVSCAIKELEQENYGNARSVLVLGQQTAEEAFISFEENIPDIKMIKNGL